MRFLQPWQDHVLLIHRSHSYTDILKWQLYSVSVIWLKLEWNARQKQLKEQRGFGFLFCWLLVWRDTVTLQGRRGVESVRQLVTLSLWPGSKERNADAKFTPLTHNPFYSNQSRIQPTKCCHLPPQLNPSGSTLRSIQVCVSQVILFCFACVHVVCILTCMSVHMYGYAAICGVLKTDVRHLPWHVTAAYLVCWGKFSAAPGARLFGLS